MSNGVSTEAKLAGFTISNSFTGIFCSDYDSPEIHDLIIKNNTKGLIVSRQANVYNSNIFDNVTGIELNTLPMRTG